MIKKEIIENIFLISDTTLQIKLDILDVYLGYRKGARIICHLNNQVECIVKVLVSSGISIAVGHGVVFQKTNNLNNVVDYFDKENELTEKLIPLYISQDNEYSEQLRAADESKEDLIFGRMLSYPECCVQKVMMDSHVPSIIEAYKYLTENNQYNVWTWPVAMVADASLLVHYPCSIDCEKSIDLAEKHWNLIKKYAPKTIKERVVKYHNSFYSFNNGKITVDYKNGELSPKTKLDEI